MSTSNLTTDDRFEQAFAASARPKASLSTGDLVVWAAGAILAVYLAFWASGLGSDRLRTVATGVAAIVLNGLAIVAARRARRDWAVAPQTRQAWGRVTFAFGAVLVGTLAAAVEEAVTGHLGRPAFADIGSAAFYPLVLWALLSFTGGRPFTQRVTLHLDFLIVAVTGTMAVWYLVLMPLADGHGGGWTVAVSMAYPVADLVVLFGVVVLLLRRPDDVSSRSLQLLVAAMALVAVSDIGYSVRSLDGSIDGAQWFHVLFVAGWAAAAMAAEAQCRQTERRTFEAYEVADEPSPFVSNLPHVAGAAAVVIVLGVAVHQGITADGGVIAGAGLLLGIAQLRQWFAVRHSNAVLEQYRDVLRTDRLTGLPNRHRFLQEAEETVVMTQLYGLPLGLVVLDIDGLRHLNAELGEAAGDAVIKEVATRCRMALRGRDLVARYGGDEIVALLPGTDAAHTDLVADRLRGELATPIDAAGRAVEVSVSVGSASVGLEVTSIGELLIAADADLEQAKRRATAGEPR